MISAATARICRPLRIGESLAIAGLFEMSDDLLAGIRRASGISGSVLDNPSANRLPLVA